MSTAPGVGVRLAAMLEGNKSGRLDAAAEECARRQEDFIAQLPPSRRLQIAQELFQTAWELKRSGLRAQYPHWTEEQIRAKARQVFITGYAGA